MQESNPGMAADQLDALSWSEMRDVLIAHAPLECAWIARVNKVRHRRLTCPQHREPWLYPMPLSLPDGDQTS